MPESIFGPLVQMLQDAGTWLQATWPILLIVIACTRLAHAAWRQHNENKQRDRPIFSNMVTPKDWQLRRGR